MGLAITYGIVKMHQGNIQVESNTDADQGALGTTFMITLPRHSPTGSKEADTGLQRMAEETPLSGTVK